MLPRNLPNSFVAPAELRNERSLRNNDVQELLRLLAVNRFIVFYASSVASIG
jgi:hypothetical protein